MKAFFIALGYFATSCLLANGQTIQVFNVSQGADVGTGFFNGQFTAVSRDFWTGPFDLSVTGITTATSSLPNPGLGSSGSGSLFADHTFNALSWDLSGSAQGNINAGLGNAGSSFPTIAQTASVGATLSFFIDTPFTINLQSTLSSQFTGNEPYDPFFGRAQTKLFAQVIDGQLVNQYVADWDTFFGSTGGSYTGSFNSAVFRLEFGADAVLDANNPGAFLNQYSSYDLQMSVQPIPEPSSALLLGSAALLRRRRRCVRRCKAPDPSMLVNFGSQAPLRASGAEALITITGLLLFSSSALTQASVVLVGGNLQAWTSAEVYDYNPYDGNQSAHDFDSASVAITDIVSGGSVRAYSSASSLLGSARSSAQLGVTQNGDFWSINGNGGVDWSSFGPGSGYMRYEGHFYFRVGEPSNVVFRIERLSASFGHVKYNLSFMPDEGATSSLSERQVSYSNSSPVTENWDLGSGTIDLSILGYGTPGYSSIGLDLGPAAVPEPGSALLLGTAALFPLHRRRRPR